MKLEALWRQLAATGTEHLILSVDGDVRADGLAVGQVEGMSYRIHYVIQCDAAWNIQQVQVEDLLNRRAGVLRRDENNLWTTEDGRPVHQLDGCSEVDIMITPFTNTLPIRRLNLTPGDSRPIAVAYIGLPGLKLSQMEQRYTCLSADENGAVYRYENLRSDFSADLRVDTDGLVVEYPNIFVMDAKRRVNE